MCCQSVVDFEHGRIPNLVLVGAGGFASEIVASFFPSWWQDGSPQLIGYVSPARADVSWPSASLPWLGTDESAQGKYHDAAAIFAIADPRLRERLVRAYSRAGIRSWTLIHASSFVSSDVFLEEGLIVGMNARVMAGCQIAPHVHIDRGVDIGHDCCIGEYSTIHPRAILSGGVRIGKRVVVGSGSVLLPGIEIGEDSIVGAGSVVTRSVAAHSTVAGNPARPLETRRSN